MKILMTTDNIGGVWTYSLDLARGLQSSGIKVVLAITGNPLTNKQRDELQEIDYYFGEFKQEWMEDPWTDIHYAGKWLMEIARLEKPDLVHLNSYSHGALPWNAPVVMVIHSCVLSWWEAVKNEKAPSSWNHYKQMVKNGMQSADIILAPSHAMMNAAEKHYGPFSRKKVIYNGRNSALFRKVPKKKFIFSMGRLWDEAKNIKAVVATASCLDYPVYIAGDKKGVKKGDLPANVHFTGQLAPDEIAACLSEAAVYYLPVLYEPFGYTFLEAAFSGCAIAGSPIDSLKEIWGENMLYTDNSDSKITAAAINSIMADDRLIAYFGNRALQHAQRYTLNHMVNNYKELYRYMLQPESRLILN